MVENIKKYAAELIGTMILVFMGCGSAMFLGCESYGGHLAVALAFGLSIIATAYVIGNISGCHINPAVSLAMLINKKLSLTDFIGYVASQIIGAFAGAGLLKLIVSLGADSGLEDLTGGLGSNGIANVGVAGAIAVEIILTFIFIFTIIGVTSDESKGGVAGIVIGLTLTFVHIVGIPLTGTSVNPARSLGPALLSGNSDAIANVWIFVAAPLVGAALAAVLFKLLKLKGGK
ncbi:MAG: MIP family channel protein [Oscillospiraceae bacterium]|nr:MIP family channel protein [Oscillospiraceae bacterium]